MLAQYILSPAGKLIAIHIPSLPHPVWIRNRTSDEYTFQQIFVLNEYDFVVPEKPKSIIDGGANIGLAAVFFASRFPQAKIICVEPEANNFQLLQKNTKPYPNITCLQGGLWSKSTSLVVRDHGWGNWGFTVEECNDKEPGAIKAFSIPDLMEKFALGAADIVKIDIEGSEKEVLEASDVHSWVQKSKVLVIEHHDRMIPGSSAALFRVLLQYDTDVEQKGENTICFINPERKMASVS